MTKKIFLAGHNGMVGKSIHQKLNELDGLEVITASKKDCDLCNQRQVNNLFRDAHIDEIYIAAARVGGINANQKNLSSFLYENIMIDQNFIEDASDFVLKKVLLNSKYINHIDDDKWSVGHLICEVANENIINFFFENVKFDINLKTKQIICN